MVPSSLKKKKFSPPPPFPPSENLLHTMLVGGYFKDNMIFYLLIYLEITQLQPYSLITETYIVTIIK